MHHAIPDNFLRSDVKKNEQRYLIFATDDQLKRLAKSKIWFLDGTFKIVKDPFVQLFSIHSFIKSESDHRKQLPLCYVLMSRRKIKDYKIVFNAILSMLPEVPIVSEAILDFESAMWTDLQNIFPNV